MQEAFQPPIILVSLRCACSSMSVPSLYWVAQTGHSTPAAAPQVLKWGVCVCVCENHTPYLLAPHLFIQFSWLAAAFATRAHGYLMLNLLSTSTLQVFSIVLLSSQSLPSLVLLHRVILSQVQDLHLPHLNVMRFLSACQSPSK